MVEPRVNCGILYTYFGLMEEVVEWFNKKRYEVIVTDYNPYPVHEMNSEIFNTEFRPGQEQCLRSISEHDHGIIRAATAFGKTEIIAKMVKLFWKAKFHVVSTGINVVRGIFNRIQTYTPDVGLYCDGVKDASKRVTCMTTNSVGLAAFGDVDFLIVDECHTAGGVKIFQKLMEKYPDSRNFGFSATPFGRGDGSNMAITALFGPVIYDMGYQEAQKLGNVVPVKVQWLQCRDYPRMSPYATKVDTKRACVWENGPRNRLAVEYVREHCDENSRILILVETVEHALVLKKELPEFTVVTGQLTKDSLKRHERRGLVDDDFEPLSQDDRADICRKFTEGEVRRVIGTDTMVQGVDIPPLDTVILMSGRSSEVKALQGAGRAVRVCEGKEHATIVDIQDSYMCETLFRTSMARHKQYENNGWTQLSYESRGRTVSTSLLRPD